MEPPANFLLVYWLTAMFLQSVPKRQTKHELFAAPPHQHIGALKQPGILLRPHLGKTRTSTDECLCLWCLQRSPCSLRMHPSSFARAVCDSRCSGVPLLAAQLASLPSRFALNPHLAVNSSIIHNLNVRKLVPISLQKLQRIWISWRSVILCFSGGKPAHSELCGTLREFPIAQFQNFQSRLYFRGRYMIFFRGDPISV